MAIAIAASLFVAIAAYHTIGGERALVGPLLDDRRWRLAGLGRRPAELLLRGAWHLTSVAWIALAAVALGVDPALALTATAALSGLALLVLLPGHPAWPAFLLVALLAGRDAEVVSEPVLVTIAGTAATVAVGAAMLHVAWAAGRAQRSMRAALPDAVDGTPAFVPSSGVTLLVAGALLALAGLLVVGAATENALADVGLVVAGLVLLARAIGDRREVGLTKTDRATPFARRDDLLYTPLVVLLAFGALA